MAQAKQKMDNGETAASVNHERRVHVACAVHCAGATCDWWLAKRCWSVSLMTNYRNFQTWRLISKTSIHNRIDSDACAVYVYTRTVSSYSYSLAYCLVHSYSSWLVWAEIECSVYVALPKRPIYQFEPVQQNRQKGLRAYCPIYILWMPATTAACVLRKTRQKAFPRLCPCPNWCTHTTD